MVPHFMHSLSRKTLFALMLCFVLGSTGHSAFASGQQNQPAATRPDSDVQSDALSAISASPVLSSQEINASTSAGQVTLSGTVDDQASKELAEMAVAKVNGVQSVINNLKIVPIGAPPTGPSNASPDYGATASAGSPQDGQQQMPPPNVSDQQADQQYGQQSDQQANNQGQQGPPPPGYPDRRGSARPPYPSANGPEGQYQYPSQDRRQAQSGPVELPKGTLLRVRLSEPLDTKRNAQGAMFQATAATDIYIGGYLAVPRGAALQGEIVDISSVKGSLGGHSSLSLKLDTLSLEGRNYSLNTDVWTGDGPGKGGYSAGNTIAGASIGAVIGGIAGGGAGAAIGATVGGATGAAASSASSSPRVVLPPETMLTFHLANAISVVPPSYQEAQRLASDQPAAGPYLDRRPGGGYPPPPGVYGYPYAYGSPYPYVYAYGYPYRYYYPRYRGYYRGSR